MKNSSAFSVEILRGGFVESRHVVSYAVWQAGVGVVDSCGDTTQKIFPRSAIKMLQVLPYLVARQAAGRTSCDPRRLALASASHWGEAQHVSIARYWLAELGLPETVLRCGAHHPFSTESTRQMAREGAEPTRLHNNCSGKHLAMIETCILNNEDPWTYWQVEHPCQRRVIDVVARLCGLESVPTEWGIDGCGIPAYRMPMESLARAMAAFASPTRVGLSDLQDAATEIAGAIRLHPELIGGASDDSSILTRESRGSALVKVGAEGIMAASAPDRGLGFVLKIHDGAERAAGPAIAHLLHRHGLLEASHDAAKNPQPIRNWAGELVGEVRVDET